MWEQRSSQQLFYFYLSKLGLVGEILFFCATSIRQLDLASLYPVRSLWTSLVLIIELFTRDILKDEIGT